MHQCWVNLVKAGCANALVEHVLVGVSFRIFLLLHVISFLVEMRSPQPFSQETLN